jgi:hypothetical protein
MIAPRRTIHPPRVLAAAVALAYGCAFSAIAHEWRVAAFIAVGLFGGLLLRSWWALALLPPAIALGSLLGIAGSGGWDDFASLPDSATRIRLAGKVLFGLALGVPGTFVLLAAPVALGRWLGRGLTRGAEHSARRRSHR